MPFLFNLQVPCDATFEEPMRHLVDRLAQFAGYQAGDAQQIGACVAVALVRLPGSWNAELQFQTSESAFELTLVIAGAVPEAPTGFTCTREGARTICRLQRKLPDAFAD